MATSETRNLYFELNPMHPFGSATIVLEPSAFGAIDGHHFIFNKDGKFEVKSLETSYEPRNGPFRHFEEKNRQAIELIFYNFRCPEAGDAYNWGSAIVDYLDRQNLVTKP
ncbi:hypothetical protein PWT90_02353 [Aphanocladium album]|nr:hypothetical protein PWT90_02353 [Aphanocladium album]